MRNSAEKPSQKISYSAKEVLHDTLELDNYTEENQSSSELYATENLVGNISAQISADNCKNVTLSDTDLPVPVDVGRSVEFVNRYSASGAELSAAEKSQLAEDNASSKIIENESADKNPMVNEEIDICSISRISNMQVSLKIKGVKVPFLIDTRASCL